MKHTIEWSVGISVALILFMVWLIVCDYWEHLNRLISITKPFV